MSKQVEQSKAIEKIIDYVLDTELDNYVEFCIENHLEEYSYTNPANQEHVYALAMIAGGQSE